MKQRNSFYITTPIYYVTAQPHLGSLYATLLADVLSRWNKLQKKEVLFLTGTDEHGQKVAQAAVHAGMEPQKFVDSLIPQYKKTWALYEIAYDYFIRTTDAYHEKGAQDFIKKIIHKGYIYKAEYKGWYCTPCETFVSEKSDGQEKGPVCPSCGRPTHIVSEESYFFKLSEFTSMLLEFYKKNPDFIIPKERAHEVIAFVESGLKDLSISRTTVEWGVPFPDDPTHTIYVWVEALCNYITAIGYDQSNKKDEFNRWWPANVHVLGKDIIKFHAVYWPALLMAADLPLPQQLLVHGWIKVDKQKMSKSFGNVIDPVALQEQYGTESVRYYLMRKIPINQDGDFSIADVETCIESDLANDLGNLLNRTVLLAHKYDAFDIPAPLTLSGHALNIRDESWNMVKDFEDHISDYMFHLALARLWKFINMVNAYFHEQEPWKKAKENRELFLEIISVTCHSLRTIALLLWPVMPQKMEELLASIGTPFDLMHSSIEQLGVDSWNKHFLLTKITPLFAKPLSAHEEKNMEKPVHNVEAPTQSQSEIGIDSVLKVELCVGTIQECHEVIESDKLLTMVVDFGNKGKRTILAGIKKWFAPRDLVGKKSIFVYNLKPRIMAGVESQGMMLVAEDKNGSKQLVSVPDVVENGTRLQ